MFSTYAKLKRADKPQLVSINSETAISIAPTNSIVLNTNTNLLSLYDNLLLDIFSFLQLNDLINIVKTCRRFEKLSKNSEKLFWCNTKLERLLKILFTTLKINATEIEDLMKAKEFAQIASIYKTHKSADIALTIDEDPKSQDNQNQNLELLKPTLKDLAKHLSTGKDLDIKRCVSILHNYNLAKKEVDYFQKKVSDSKKFKKANSDFGCFTSTCTCIAFMAGLGTLGVVFYTLSYIFSSQNSATVSNLILLGLLLFIASVTLLVSFSNIQKCLNWSIADSAITFFKSKRDETTKQAQEDVRGIFATEKSNEEKIIEVDEKTPLIQNPQPAQLN